MPQTDSKKDIELTPTMEQCYRTVYPRYVERFGNISWEEFIRISFPHILDKLGFERVYSVREGVEGH